MKSKIYLNKTLIKILLHQIHYQINKLLKILLFFNNKINFKLYKNLKIINKHSFSKYNNKNNKN